MARVKSAHEEHYQTLSILEKELRRRNIEYTAIARANLRESVDNYDLVASVGDGTFLDASHAVHSVPLLGVNSSQSISFGHLCIANRQNLTLILDQIQSGTLKPCPLLRLQLSLNGVPFLEPVLNEVLVCHSNPAGTSRYIVSVDGIKEERRSTSIWVNTNRLDRSAAVGGTIMPITSRKYQFLVREPWTRPGRHLKLAGAILEQAQAMRVNSSMRTGTLFIDGHHVDYSFSISDELLVQASENDLMSYVNPQINNIFMEE